MIRAIFFDFYSVWTPDKLAYYLAYAELMDPSIYKQVLEAVEKYYQGDMSLDDVTGTIRYKLGANDIDNNAFKLSSNSISPEIANFMQSLHGHFVKVGILANLGKQEHELLKEFNDKALVFESVVSAYSFNIKKPLLDPEVFSKAFESVDEPADSCLYVSGNPDRLAYARLTGMQTLQFEGLSKLEADLNQMLSGENPDDKNI